MLGLMQHHPLLLSSVIAHAARHHPRAEVVSVELDGTRHRSDYATVERRSRQLLTALTSALSVQPGERVATLAWNTHRHLELYYGISGLGAVCHTVNPRLPLDDIAYIMTDAGNRVVFADLSFVPLLEQLAPRLPGLKHAVLLCAKDAMPAQVAGLTLHAYEDLVEAAAPAAAWPRLRREHRQRALLHLRHNGAAEGRAVFPPFRDPARHGLQLRRPLRAARDRPRDAGIVHVPRHRLGRALLGADGGRGAGDAGPASRPGQPRGADRGGRRRPSPPPCRPSGSACWRRCRARSSARARCAASPAAGRRCRAC